MFVPGWMPWYQGSWGQHGAHLGPTGPRWVPWWHHELCYLGTHTECVGLMESFYIIIFFLILWHFFSHWFFDERDALRTMVSNFMLIWRHWTYEMPVRYILLSVWVRLSILSLLSIIQYVGLYVFSLPISLVMIEIIYILCLIIIIKSEVWTNTHCLGLGHKTMVSAVCIFLYSYAYHLFFSDDLIWYLAKSYWNPNILLCFFTNAECKGLMNIFYHHANAVYHARYQFLLRRLYFSESKC